MRKRFLSTALVVLLPFGAAAQEAQEAAQAEVPPPAPPAPTYPTAEAQGILADALQGDLSQDLALRFAPYFFPSFQGGTMFMVAFRVGTRGLMFGVDTDALEPASIPAGGMPTEVAHVELFGGVYRGDEQVMTLGTAAKLDRVGVEDSGLTATYSFGDTLDAGSYRFVWGIRDLVSGNVSTVDQPLEVPDLGAGSLGTSSVVLVEGQPAPASGMFQAGSVYRGLRVATASFTDNLVHAFPKMGPPIMLTFVVTGAQRDPATGVPNFSLRYQIRDGSGQAIWGTPAQPYSRATIGQPLRFEDIEQVSAGNDYVLVILLEDLTNDAAAETEVPFRIIE